MVHNKNENDNKLGIIIGLVVILSIIEIGSRTILKKAHDKKDEGNNKTKLLIVASILLYISVILLLYYSMNFGKFITISALWDAGTILLATISSYYLLNESINKGEFIGLGFIGTGVIIMAMNTN
jgi:uncharacterized membrane protein